MNIISFWTLLRREIARFFSIFEETIIPSVISVVLYLIVFGYSIGNRVGDFEGISYTKFIVPGLLMLDIVAGSYANTAFSLYMSRRFYYIKDILSSPLSYLEMVLALTLGAIVRALIVGAVIFVVALILVKFSIFSWFFVLFYFLIVSLIFASIGIIVGLISEEFEHISLPLTFFLTKDDVTFS